MRGLRDWLQSEDVEARSERGEWPAAETAPLWLRFREEIVRRRDRAWTYLQREITVEAEQKIIGKFFRIDDRDPASLQALTADFREIGSIEDKFTLPTRGLAYGRLVEDERPVLVTIGPR